MGRVIEIDYAPRPEQKQIHEALLTHRFVVAVCHRRFGKTFAALQHLQRGAIVTTLKNPRLGFIAPTYRQGKDIAWAYLKEFSRPIPGMKFHESELKATYPNGAQIRVAGADNPDALRGVYWDGVVLDEVAQMPAITWPEVIRPALADRKGWALFIGTPKGDNYFRELYDHARYGRDPEWASLLFTVEDTTCLDPEEVESARRQMSHSAFQQEFMCSFTAALLGAYYAHELEAIEQEDRVTEVAHDPMLDVNLALDLGMADDTAMVWWQQSGNQVRFIDSYSGNNMSLQHYLDVIHSKPYRYNKLYAPHDIQVRDLGTGLSRLEVALKSGINFDLTPNLRLQDGIEAARRVLMRSWFDSKKCSDLLKALRNYHRKQDSRTGRLLDTPEKSWANHFADAFRYAALSIQPMRARKKRRWARFRQRGVMAS